MIIKHLSPSRINTFDQCQLKYYAIYEEMLDEGVPHPLTMMGKAVHKGAEVGTKAIMDGEVVNSVNFPALVKRACASMRVSKPNADLGVELIQNALKWGYLRNIEHCVGVEKSFFIELPDGTKVKGIMDRVDLTPKYMDIVDLKTQKKAFDDATIADLWQSIAYNWAARRLFPEHQGDVRMSYWTLRHRVQRVWMSADDAKRGEDKMMEKAEEIRSCTEPEPSPSPLCQWCPKQADCPASREGVKQRFKRKNK